MTMEAALACPVRPQVDTGWLALPLSARGIIDELGKYTDDNARVVLQLDAGADADAVGKEIARLLCAHPGELARVRRDTKKLLDRGDIAVDGSAIRLSRIAHETARSVVERPRAMTAGERQQLCRDRKKAELEAALASSRKVTAEGDEFRDVRHDASVTPSLSFKNDLNLKSLKERETVTAIVTAERDGISKNINDERRARAKELGLAEERIDVIWLGFFVRHEKGGKTARQLDELWAEWVCRRLAWDAKQRGGPKKAVREADLDAPWIVDAMGGES
jgi:hypothetical protein